MTTATRIIFSPVVSSNPARTIINQFTLRSKIKKILKDHAIDGASITKNTGIWRRLYCKMCIRRTEASQISSLNPAIGEAIAYQDNMIIQ